MKTECPKCQTLYDDKEYMFCPRCEEKRIFDEGPWRKLELYPWRRE